MWPSWKTWRPIRERCIGPEEKWLVEDGTYKGHFANKKLVSVERVSPWGIRDITRALSSDEIELLEGVFLASIVKNDGSMSHILVEDGAPRLMRI